MVGIFLNNSGRMLLAFLVSHASAAAVSNDMFQTSPSLLTVDHPHHAADNTGATVVHHAAPAAASNNNVIVSFDALLVNIFHGHLSFLSPI